MQASTTYDILPRKGGRDLASTGKFGTGRSIEGCLTILLQRAEVRYTAPVQVIALAF